MANELPGLKVVGIVSNDIKQPTESGYAWKDVISEIVIDNKLTEALDNIDQFSHIIVLFYIHRSTINGQLPQKVHPRGDPELPLIGLFATRSQHRPNPIGKTTVRLLNRQGNRLRVKGLDAIDGTPVIDIKPYIPEHDSVNNARVPSWATNH